MNQADNEGATPVFRAAEAGHGKCVELLLRKPGAAVNQVNNYGETPLLIATMEGREKCVQQLLLKGGSRVTWSCCATLLRCRKPVLSMITCCCACSCACKRTLARDDAELVRDAMRSNPPSSPDQQSMAI